MYTTLLRLVEGIAQQDDTRFFNRPVTVMCDFEDGFINAIKDNYESVNIKCCFFHFVKNIRKKANRIITRIKRLWVSGHESSFSPRKQKDVS